VDDQATDIAGVEKETQDREEDNKNQHQIDREMDSKYGPREHSHGLRPRRKPNFTHLHEPPIAAKPSDYDETHANLQHTTLTQYSIKKGLEVFKEAGADAVVKEMQQLDERNVIEPKHANMLTREEKRTHWSTSCF